MNSMSDYRRSFLKRAAYASGVVAAGSAFTAVANESSPGKLREGISTEDLQIATNSRFLGDKLVAWQSPYGGPDVKRSPYRSAGTGAIIQGVGPQVRAMYRLFEESGDAKYKNAADRHAVFMLCAIHDPWQPYSSMLTVTGKPQFALSAAWVYGKGFSPCFQWFRKHNPAEDSFDLKVHAMYRWLQFHRRDDCYFGVGYPIPGYADAQFSCDLGEVGNGLLGFYEVTKHEPALLDAVELAKYFLTDYKTGSGAGVWSAELGTWLVGPWPGGGSEHFTDQQYNEVGWGWSCLVVSEFLLELRRHEVATPMRENIDAKCLSSLKWCFDNCQFEDGAHGMFGRDDKWVGQGAAAILLYAKLQEQGLIPDTFKKQYRPKLQLAWEYLVEHTSDATYPDHGYTRVTGKTTTNPPENLLWMMSWTIEALLIGKNLVT